MRKLGITFLIFVFTCSFALAQDNDVSANLKETDTDGNAFGTRPAETPFALLDVSRIKWSHSYSVSYFSGGGRSGSAGLLNTGMFYEFSEDLSLAVNVGILHNPGSFFGPQQTDATILPSFTLDYHPSENFRMSVSYRSGLGYSPYDYYSPYSPLYRPWRSPYLD